MSLQYFRDHGQVEWDPSIKDGMFAKRDSALFGTEFDGPSRTRQEFQEECDINAIMKRYNKTGVITHYSKREPQYFDFGEVPDFHTAMNVMLEAEIAFMRLPADVRKRFENDPQEFVRFAADKDNLDQMRKWGLAEPEKAPDAPMRVEVVNPPAAGSEGP